jgi:hypothetical protein
MISELSQPARIASLECGLVKIPFLTEGFVSNVGAARMNFVAHLPAGWLGTFCFLFSSVFLAVALVQKNPPVRSADSPVLIWDIDLTLARAWPRNVQTTDDPLKASADKTPSTTGLIDLHASGSREFTADNLRLLLMRMHGPVTIFDLRQETHTYMLTACLLVGLQHAIGRMSVAARLKSKKRKPHGRNRLNRVAELPFG